MHGQLLNTSDPLWRKQLVNLRHDVYHLPEYLEIEARRINASPGAFLYGDDDKIFFIPYLLRSCSELTPLSQQSVFDIVSPYGYPGPLLSEAAIATPNFPDLALDAFMQTLRQHNVCSVFFRLHPVLNWNIGQCFQRHAAISSGETVSFDLRLSEDQNWAQTRKGHRSSINRCKRLFTPRIVSFQDYYDEFISIYSETLHRVNAKDLYFFSQQYFTDLLNLGDKLKLCLVEDDYELAAAMLLFECCSIVQAHLGGTRNKFLDRSPFMLTFDYVRSWAAVQPIHFFGLRLVFLRNGINFTRCDL
jgi:hypothetical protein